MIKTLTDLDNPAWDKYVENTPAATFFHQSGWKQVIERAFGHNTYMQKNREK